MVRRVEEDRQWARLIGGKENEETVSDSLERAEPQPPDLYLGKNEKLLFMCKWSRFQGLVHVGRLVFEGEIDSWPRLVSRLKPEPFLLDRSGANLRHLDPLCAALELLHVALLLLLLLLLGLLHVLLGQGGLRLLPLPLKHPRLIALLDGVEDVAILGQPQGVH